MKDFAGIKRARNRSGFAWGKYLRKPYKSHAEYASQIKRVMHKYAADMKRRDGAGKKSRSIKSILQAAMSARHYGYLFNNAIFAAQGSNVKGTMVNEAAHKQMKGWGQCVTQQHQKRIIAVGKAFGLYKLMGRLSGTLRVPEARVLALTTGRICAHGVSALWPNSQEVSQIEPPPQCLDASERARKPAWKAEQKRRRERRSKQDAAQGTNATKNVMRKKKGKKA